MNQALFRRQSCIFRAWALTEGVFCVVSAMNLSHFDDFSLYSRMHFRWQVQYWCTVVAGRMVLSSLFFLYWLKVKDRGFSERYQARGCDRRIVNFSPLLGSAPFWALPEYAAGAGKKTIPWPASASFLEGNLWMLGAWLPYDMRWRLSLFQCHLQEQTLPSQCGIGIQPLVKLC